MKSENPLQTATFSLAGLFLKLEAAMERKYKNPKNSADSNYTL